MFWGISESHAFARARLRQSRVRHRCARGGLSSPLPPPNHRGLGQRMLRSRQPRRLQSNGRTAAVAVTRLPQTNSR
ncbi:hypothetical protein RA210_U270003 [Rubrivivax sp. A210]|nr:hypothetical protein RA210_U270003 [Rubrivivax sp. A210]